MGKKLIWKSRSPTIRNPDKWLSFCQEQFEILTFEWSKFGMVGTIAKALARPFENRTIRNRTFKKSWFQMFPDLQLVRFQIPTVFALYLVTINKHFICKMIQIKGWKCLLWFMVRNLLFSLSNACLPDLRWDISIAKSIERTNGDTCSITALASFRAT